MKKNKIVILSIVILACAAAGFLSYRFKFPSKLYGKAGQSAENTQGGSGTVDPSTATPTAVKLYLVKNTSFTAVIDGLIGTIKGDVLELSFGEQQEKLTHIHVKVGDMVRQGKKLMELDHTRSEARKNQTEIALIRMRQLHKVGGATAQDVKDSLQSFNIANQDYQDTFIYAPKSGYVSEINKRVGETVNRGETAIVVVSTESKFYLETGITEGQIENVKEGQESSIRVLSLGNQELKGKVSAVSRQVTVTGRTGTVQISLPDSIQNRLRPGLSAQCSILAFFSSDALVIPADAYDQKEESVYLVRPGQEQTPDAKVQEGKRVIKTKVVLGYLKRDYFQVAGGLNPGDQIVANLRNTPVQDNTPITSEGPPEEYKGE